MLPPDKAGLLRSFLGSLPGHLAVRLAKAVEIDRLMDGAQLPHDTILEGLRPALRRGHEARTPNPLRLFCRPFEDLLTAAPRRDKQKGRIARTSVVPVWRWIGETLLPAETALYEKDIKALILAHRPDDAKARAIAFWSCAAEAMKAAIARDAKSVSAILGGDLALADADEMALMLSVAPEILVIHDLLPKPAPSLGEDRIWELRAVYDRMLQAAPDAAPYVAVVAMGRLARPWEALRLPIHISRRTQDTLISRTDMGLVGDILLAEIEAHGAAIRAVRQPLFDAGELIGHLEQFTELSLGIVKEIEIRRDGEWGQRLLRDRAEVGEVMAGFMERAPKEIAAALPTHRSGGFAGGPRVPDLARPAEPERNARALAYARLIAGCRPFAAAASFGAKLRDAEDETAQFLRPYGDDLVRELRAAEGELRAAAERQFALALELTRLAMGEDEAEFLRRRGTAARAQAPAAA